MLRHALDMFDKLRFCRLHRRKERQRTAPLIVHACHHKTGTVWFKNILWKVCQVHDWQFHYGEQADLPPEAHVFMQSHSRITPKKLPQFIGTHMIRDPRDVVVSCYQYHKKYPTKEEWLTKPYPGLNGASYGEHLQTLNEEDGLLFEIDHAADYTIRQMMDWNYNDPHFLELTYEAVQQDYDGWFERIFRHYGMEGDILAQAMQIADSEKLEKRKGVSKHILDGTTGRWQSVFTPKVEQVFMDRHGKAMQMLGYQ